MKISSEFWLIWPGPRWGFLPFKAYIGMKVLNFNHAAVFLNER
ncbi:MAG: hypothetical protein WBM24_17235 [Candidatus Sulfotelmatobacter sp.]